MFNISSIIKKLAPIIREERSLNQERYEYTRQKMENIVVMDLKIKKEDIQQRVWDNNKMLWEDIYKPYDKELLDLLRILNKFEKDHDGSAVDLVRCMDCHRKLKKIFHG